MSAPAAAEQDFEPMIDAAELSRRTGIPERTVYDLVKAGKLPHYRWSRRGVRFLWSEVLSANKREQLREHNKRS